MPRMELSCGGGSGCRERQWGVNGADETGLHEVQMDSAA